MKKCSKCKVLKVLDNFNKRKDSPNGYRHQCRECCSEYLKNYLKNPPKKEIVPEGKKRCCGCKKLLVLSKDSFHKCKNSPGGYKAQCKECRNADNKKHREQNPEYYLEWRDNNKEHIKELNKKYQKENQEKLKAKKKEYVAANKEIVAKRKNRWYEKNKDKVMENKRRRRARKLEVDENYTQGDRRITMKEFGYCCFNCSSKEKLCIDHHRPLVDGHPLTLSNAVVLCKICNSSKSIKSPEKFYGVKVAEGLDEKLICIAESYKE